MTFTARLRLFFSMMVVIPMVALGVTVFLLVGSDERSEDAARSASALRAGEALQRRAHDDAVDALAPMRADRGLRRALARRDSGAATRALRRLVREQSAVRGASLRMPGRKRVAVGSREIAAPARSDLDDRRGRRLGEVAVSTLELETLVGELGRVSGGEGLVSVGGHVGATTLGRRIRRPVGDGDIELAGVEYRSSSRAVPPAGSRAERLTVLLPRGGMVTRTRVLVSASIVLLLAIAAGFASLLLRALRRQIAQFLTAARRLSSGSFDARVAVRGDDEFAQLGQEFNTLAARLATKMTEVDDKRQALQATVRRVGQAFAAGLDPHAALDLTAWAAVDACEADYGRAQLLPVSGLLEVEAGDPSPSLREALDGVERVLERRSHDLDADGRFTEPIVRPLESERDGVHSLALTLMARRGAGGEPRPVGQLAVARAGAAFLPRERETFEYLCSQAIVSIENADLHETVQRQAITDELTGLANLRELHRAIDREFERGRRYDTALGLVLLDIDDFKAVNDVHGHQIGDEVLRRVAGVLRRHSREVDEPARYGGEELAIVLPQTGSEGAVRFAERLRCAVEGVGVPVGSRGQEVTVTASFGVASVPVCAASKQELIAAADGALYRAKRAGKNRVELAQALVSTA